MKWWKLSAKIRRDQPLCTVCRNPSAEVAHLVSQMEFRREFGNRHPLRNDMRNLAALCKRCHIALDCHLRITDWYVKQRSIKSFDFFLKHFDRHFYGFQKLLDRRCLLLCELENYPRPGTKREAGHVNIRNTAIRSPGGPTGLARPRQHAVEATTA